MQDEIEIKVKVEQRHLKEIRSALSALGFRQKASRSFEENLLFDFHDDRLQQEGCALRLRQYGGTCLLTYKGPKKQDPRLKIREEIESRVESFDGLKRILHAVGMKVTFEYSKFREKWVGAVEGQEVELCLDETPVGCFVEIEGGRLAISLAASELGWKEDSFITKNYVDLYREARSEAS